MRCLCCDKPMVCPGGCERRGDCPFCHNCLDHCKCDDCADCAECGGEGKVDLHDYTDVTVETIEPTIRRVGCPRCKGDGKEPAPEDLEGHPAPGEYNYRQIEKEERADAEDSRND